MDAIAQLNSALAGRYTVDREIGRGGMAAVYLARDTRHNRPVALKVLNPELGAVLGVERFLSEIQVTANLQHPNLLPLFDSGEADGLLFYVMPYIEGESLRAALTREKQLSIDDALRIATAVASALDYAHRHGVIHRDLKPENILLHEGQPLVADFGIALAVTNAGGNRITQTGLSLGTPHYMSPEQATGDRTVDGRTDVYSLGAVTYEMLTGEPPHTGTTAQAIIAKVLTDKPRSIRLARDTVPLHVEGAVEQALAKLPADRFHTAQEFADALNGKTVSTFTQTRQRAGARTDVAGRRTIGGQILLYAPWLLVVASLVVAVIGWRRLRDSTEETLRYEIRLVRGTPLVLGRRSPVAISRGGAYVAYLAGDRVPKLYLRAANDLQPHEVPGSDFASVPFFSPDGKWVVFWANAQLKKAPIAGGNPVLIAEVPSAGIGGTDRATWATGDQIVFVLNGRLAVMSAAGAGPRPISTPDTAHGETAQLAPIALPDGKHVLYTSLAMGGTTAAHIGVASIDDGRTTILPIQGSRGIGMLDGHLIYATAAGAVMAVPFDLATRRVTGTPIQLIDQVTAEIGATESYVDMSADGALAYVTSVSRRQLMETTNTGQPRALLPDADNYAWPRLSPDGRHLAITRRSSIQSDVWIYELPSGPLTRLTTEGTSNDRPEWMPDSKHVVFRSNRSGSNAVWIQPIDGSGDAKLLYADAHARIDEAVVSPDGKYLLYQRDVTGRGELWFKALAGDTMPKRVGAGAFGEISGRFSPDGKWVVYISSQSGTAHVYVRPFPALDARYQISLTGGAAMPMWSPDGKRIFYRSGRYIIAATIASTQPFAIASRENVLSESDFNLITNGIHADFDVLKDGRTFLAFQSVDDDAHLVVVRNWRRELRTRASAAR